MTSKKRFDSPGYIEKGVALKSTKQQPSPQNAGNPAGLSHVWPFSSDKSKHRPRFDSEACQGSKSRKHLATKDPAPGLGVALGPILRLLNLFGVNGASYIRLLVEIDRFRLHLLFAKMRHPDPLRKTGPQMGRGHLPCMKRQTNYIVFGAGCFWQMAR